MGGKKKKLAPGAGGEGGGAGGGLQTIAMHDAPPNQVWSLTQFYSVDFQIGVKKCVFSKRTIKVCVSCC